MKYPIFQIIRIYRLAIWVILFFQVNSNIANNIPSLKKEADSLKILVEHCHVDTCKFQILSNFFWKYAITDFEHVKSVGEWAYNEIKNSRNLKALSEGYDIKGFLLVNEKNLDSSYYFYNKALLTSSKIGYKRMMAWSNYNIGRYNVRRWDPKTALFFFKQAENIFLGKNQSKPKLGAMWYIGLIYYNLNNYDTAFIYFNKRIECLNKNHDTNNEIIARIELAIICNKMNNMQKSSEQINRVLKLSENIGNNIDASNVNMLIGDYLFDTKKNNKLALEYYNKALKGIKNYQNIELEATIYNKIGELYLREGKDSSALIWKLTSLGIAKKLDIKNLLIYIYESLGYTYKNMGKHQLALYNFKMCIETESGSIPKIFCHEAFIEIADIYMKLNNPNEALAYYKKALDLAERYHAKKETATSYLKLGNYYMGINQFHLTAKYLLLSLRAARESNDQLLIQSTAESLSQYYFKNNNYKPAYSYQRLARLMKDSLLKSDERRNRVDLTVEFEFEKLKKENEAKQTLNAEEIKKQKIFRNSLFIITGLLVFVGILIFNGYRRKKRGYRLLIERNDEIEEKNQEIQAQVEEITMQKNEIARISNELHKSDEMKLRFFSNISHEFRTPLALIINPAQSLLKTFPGNDEYKKQLGIIFNNAQKLHDLTNQIMDLQKLDAGKLKLDLEKADIVEYCLGITSFFESLCNKKNNVIKFISNHQSVILSLTPKMP